jgi:hypothetical protein
MEDIIKIQLGEFQNVDAVNQDLRLRLPLGNNEKLITEYNINNVLDVTSVYEAERQDSETYRLYGEIEYLSPLNYMTTGYTEVEDFFTIFPLNATIKTILPQYNQ